MDRVVTSVGASGGSLGGQPGALTTQFFFYGTLMGGLKRDAAKYLILDLVGPATVRGDMYAVGNWFPAICPGDGLVHGELWRACNEDHALAVLEMTDQVEGYRPGDAHNLYDRQETRLETPDGETAWTYWWNGGRTGRRGLERVPHGDWRRWLSEPTVSLPAALTGRRPRR